MLSRENGMGERMTADRAPQKEQEAAARDRARDEGGRRPRVAVINTHPIQHFAPLWAEIAQRGEVSLKVLYCSDWGVKEYKDPGFDRTFRWDVDLLSGYDYELLPIAKRPAAMSFREVDNPEVGDALARFQPDVLVLFGYTTLTNWRALAWARRSTMAKGAKKTRVLVFSDSELKHARPILSRAAKEIVVRAFFSQVDGALPIGNCNAEYYRRYGLPEDVLYPCPLPVDGKRFLAAAGDTAEARASVRRELGIPEGDFVFASVGKYIPRKRHADVAAAFLELPVDLREKSRVLLIGDGPDRGSLAALAARGDGRIGLTGFVNQSQMPGYFAACDALVVASDHDPHPLVVTEGLFLGLPVIASDRIGCIGPDDTVRPGENGIAYAAGNIKDLSRAMLELLVNRAKYERFKEQSRRIAASQDTPVAAARFAEAALRSLKAEPATAGERARRLLPLPRSPRRA
jgi:glycosyltransferase involved in cell wall biosynthesis